MSDTPDATVMAEWIDELVDLLSEARGWVKAGYGASFEDIEECRDMLARIDKAIAEARE
jgi:hypothetical protein